MKKTIVSALALFLMLQGCNDDTKEKTAPQQESQNQGTKNQDAQNQGTKNQEATQAKITQELKDFVQNKSKTDSLIKKGISSSTAETSTKSEKVSYQKMTTNGCSDGGTKSLDTNFDVANLSQTEIIERVAKGITISLGLDNCIEDGTKSNGEISVTITEKNELSTMLMTFTKDTTFEDIEKNEVATVFKNSNVKIIELSDTEEKSIENINFSQSATEKYQLIDLISYEKELSTGTSSYNVSGKVKYNETTYTVDEKYTANKTPMVSNEKGDLLSGTEKYYNEKGEHVTFKVVAKNKIKISLDKDNDGVDDAEETLSL